MQIFLFFALFIALMAVVFALQNSAPVQVSFLLWRFDSSLALVLLVALLSGALMSFFVSLPSNVRARWTIRQQRKKMNEMETNLADLKAQLAEVQKQIEGAHGAASEITASPIVEPPVEDAAAEAQ